MRFFAASLGSVLNSMMPLSMVPRLHRRIPAMYAILGLLKNGLNVLLASANAQKDTANLQTTRQEFNLQRGYESNMHGDRRNTSCYVQRAMHVTSICGSNAQVIFTLALTALFTTDSGAWFIIHESDPKVTINRQR